MRPSLSLFLSNTLDYVMQRTRRTRLHEVTVPVEYLALCFRKAYRPYRFFSVVPKIVQILTIDDSSTMIEASLKNARIGRSKEFIFNIFISIVTLLFVSSPVRYREKESEQFSKKGKKEG